MINWGRTISFVFDLRTNTTSALASLRHHGGTVLVCADLCCSALSVFIKCFFLHVQNITNTCRPCSQCVIDLLESVSWCHFFTFTVLGVQSKQHGERVPTKVKSRRSFYARVSHYDDRTALASFRFQSVRTEIDILRLWVLVSYTLGFCDFARQKKLRFWIVCFEC